jgi:site-specific DNA-cytosine methylase
VLAAEGGGDEQVAWTVHGANSNVTERHAYEDDTARCLDTGGGFMPNQGGTLIAATVQGGGRRGHRVDAEGAAGGHLIAQPIDPYNQAAGGDVAYTLDSQGARQNGQAVMTAHPVTTDPVAFANQHRVKPGGVAEPVTGSNGQPGGVMAAAAVRRLTPLECERLQGFPDGWTAQLANGEAQSDSARYRQCGNAVAVPVAEWIAWRLAAVDAAAR